MPTLSTNIKSFKDEITDVYKSYRFSHFALYLLRDTFNKAVLNNNVRVLSLSYKNDESSTVKYDIDDMDNSSENGKYQVILAGNTIVIFYNLWEDKYRRILSCDMGFANKSELKNNLFGELGKIRNSIIHNYYERSSEIDKLKLTKYLFPSKTFILDSYMVDEIFNLIIKELSLLNNTAI